MPGTLTHSPAVVIRQLLEDLSVAGDHTAAAGSWPSFAGDTPQDPDDVVVVKNTPGENQGREMVESERAELDGIQIMVRHANPETGRTRANLIATKLDTDTSRKTVTVDEVTGTATTAYLVHTVIRQGPVLDLNKGIAGGTTVRDKRSMFTINALVSLRETS